MRVPDPDQGRGPADTVARKAPLRGEEIGSAQSLRTGTDTGKLVAPGPVLITGQGQGTPATPDWTRGRQDQNAKREADPRRPSLGKGRPAERRKNRRDHLGDTAGHAKSAATTAPPPPVILRAALTRSRKTTLETQPRQAWSISPS